MSVSVIERTFPSADGRHHVHATIYRPSLDVRVRGIVQLVHGMIDHSGRYRDLAIALASAGYAVGVHDHLGHGRTAIGEEDFGFFAARGGVELVLADIHTMMGLLKAEFAGLPLVLAGHSMGSFLTRLYVARHPHEVSAYLMLGTGGPNPLLPLGRLLAATIRLFAGAHYRSRAIASMAFAGYNAHFDAAEGPRAWLSRDQAYLNRDGEDPYTGFIFTVAAYQDLFRMLGACNTAAWYRAYPKELPTLIMSGDEDPVGAYGKGPSHIYRKLLVAGAARVELRLYEGARHELFNETCRDEFVTDVLTFIGTVCP